MVWLPTLFVSHGAPTLALDPGPTGAMLDVLGRALRRQFGEGMRSILAISPHWTTERPLVQTRDPQAVIHDFYGFPRPLYALDYPAAGAPGLARRAAALLAGAGIAAGEDPKRGLDHGAWVPLRMLRPAADLPVTQLSMPRDTTPAEQFRIGHALAPLAGEGVLILGSGSFTHNLHEVRFGAPDGEEAGYVRAFAEWMAARLGAGDLDALLDYRRQAPHAERAHPTDEHLMALYAVMGAAGGEGAGEGAGDWTRLRHFDTGATYGVLRMDAFAFGGEVGALSAAFEREIQPVA